MERSNYLDQYGQLIAKWLNWQEYHVKSEEALEKASFLMTGSAGVWYNNLVVTENPKGRKYPSFLCFLFTSTIMRGWRANHLVTQSFHFAVLCGGIVFLLLKTARKAILNIDTSQPDQGS